MLQRMELGDLTPANARKGRYEAALRLLRWGWPGASPLTASASGTPCAAGFLGVVRSCPERFGEPAPATVRKISYPA
jgi:hypothetical protein